MKKVNKTASANLISNNFLLLLLLAVITFCTVIIVTNTGKVNYLVSQFTPQPTTTPTPANTVIKDNFRTLTGTLKKSASNVVDDVTYQYYLVLDSQFQTTQDTLLVGGNGLAPKVLGVVIRNLTLKNQVDKALNRHYSLTGEVKWGFAQTKYIDLTSGKTIK